MWTYKDTLSFFALPLPHPRLSNIPLSTEIFGIHDEGRAEIAHSRYSFQVGGHLISPTEKMELAITTGFSILNIKKIQHFPTNDPLRRKFRSQLNYISSHRRSLLWEVAITARSKKFFDLIGFQAQEIMSFNSNNPGFPQRNIRMTVGFYLEVPPDLFSTSKRFSRSRHEG